MAGPASLMRDWDLLQEHVMPHLLHVAPSRRPRAWTIGPPQDAVAVALAYNHAHGDPDRSDICVHLSEREDRGPVDFALADIRCVPQSRRAAAFSSVERRLRPNDGVTRKVYLRAPSTPVDVVTVRTEAGAGRAAEHHPAAAALRTGGRLVVTGGPVPDEWLDRFSLRAVEPSGRVLEKLSGEVSAPAAGSGCANRAGPSTLAERMTQRSLVASHLNLARSLARRFSRHGEPADDLEQVALLALVKAAGRFSDDHGTSFATFATASVIGELKRHFRDKTWMLRVPRSLQETYLSVKSAREELVHELGASPTVPQIAGHLRIPEESVLAAMEAADSYWPASLDAQRRDEEGGGVEVPVTEPGFDRSLERRELQEHLPRLAPAGQHLVRRLFFDGATQREVAGELGVSQMQVSRLLARTLSTLRDAMGEHDPA